MMGRRRNRGGSVGGEKCWHKRKRKKKETEKPSNGLVYCKKRDRYFPAGTVFSDDEVEELNKAPTIAARNDRLHTVLMKSSHGWLLARELGISSFTWGILDKACATVRVLEQAKTSCFSEFDRGFVAQAFIPHQGRSEIIVKAFGKESVLDGGIPFAARLEWGPRLQPDTRALFYYAKGESHTQRVCLLKHKEEDLHVSQVLYLQQSSGVSCTAMGRCTPRIAYVSGRNDLLIINYDSERVDVALRTRNDFLSQSFVENDSGFLLGGKSSSIFRCDLRGRGLTRLCRDSQEAAGVTAIHACHDSQRVLVHKSGSLSQHIFCLDQRKHSDAKGRMAPLYGFEGHVWNHRPIAKLGLDESETFLSVVGLDKLVRIWDIRTGRLIHAPISVGSRGNLNATGDSNVFILDSCSSVMELFVSLYDEASVHVSLRLN